MCPQWLIQLSNRARQRRLIDYLYAIDHAVGERRLQQTLDAHIRVLMQRSAHDRDSQVARGNVNARCEPPRHRKKGCLHKFSVRAPAPAAAPKQLGAATGRRAYEDFRESVAASTLGQMANVAPRTIHASSEAVKLWWCPPRGENTSDEPWAPGTARVSKSKEK
jgi:hypothetical protein